ncbi:MAG: hypothetical protein QM654_16815 [Dysgonamonadaceae bacterium]
MQKDKQRSPLSLSGIHPHQRFPSGENGDRKKIFFSTASNGIGLQPLRKFYFARPSYNQHLKSMHNQVFFIGVTIVKEYHPHLKSLPLGHSPESFIFLTKKREQVKKAKIHEPIDLHVPEIENKILRVESTASHFS